jgi:lipase
MTGPSSTMLTVNGVELCMFEWPGSDPPILLCHATGFHARCWDQVVARLAGRHCYAFDTRGHGRSTKPAPPYPWRNFGADTAAVASALNLCGAIGAGHSMGGHAVTLPAALNPDAFERLVLLDPVIRPKGSYLGPWLEARYVAKRRDRWTSPDEMFERFHERPPFAAWDPAVLRDYCDYGLLPDGDEFVLACPPAIEAAIYENSSVPESDIHAEIAAIDMPVLVARSARPPSGLLHDMSASPTAPDLAQSFRHGKDLPLPEHSHFIPMEDPALMANLILQG